MLQVLHPLGLLALGALAVPILIHLRHRPRPRVRVGSLRPFLGHALPARSRTLQEWPLLLLRCAVLSALALALAGLRWQPATAPPARWCLLVPGTQLRDSHLQEWNRLLQEGFEPRELSPHFPMLSDRAPTSTPDLTADLWSWLQQADRQLPPESTAWVFGPTWAGWFRGPRPTLPHLKVQWHEVPTPAPTIPTPQPPRVAVVHSPDRARDAQYVRAALQALRIPIVTHEAPDWIFQLGSAALPPEWTAAHQQGAVLIRDASNASSPESVSRTFDGDGRTIRLRQRIAPGPGTPLFRDSQGEPWLTEERQASAVTWHLAFRFHPDWTDWPLEGFFPAWWKDRLQPQPFNTSPIATEQAAPRFDPTPASATSLSRRPPPIDLRPGCWLLAVILFLLERALALRRTANAKPALSISTPS